MQFLPFVLRVHIHPPSLVGRAHPCVILRRDDRQQLPPCERVSVLRIHEPAQLPSHILEGIARQRHPDMVVLHLGGDGDGLYLRVMDAVLYLLLRRLIVLRAVHREVLELRIALHRLLRYVIQLRNIVQRHPWELLQSVIEFRVDLVVLAPVDTNRVPDVHAVDDRIEVLIIFVSLPEQPINDERPIEPEVVEEDPLALPKLDLLEEGEHVLPMQLHPQVASHQRPQPHTDIAVLLQVGLGGRLEVSRPHILLLQSHSKALFTNIPIAKALKHAPHSQHPAKSVFASCL